MTDRILTLAEVANRRIVPLSKSTLYKLARSGEAPFYMVGGKYMAFEADLYRWVREGQGGRKARPKRPGPMPKRRTTDFLTKIEALTKD